MLLPAALALRWDGLGWTVMVTGAVFVLVGPFIFLAVSMLLAIVADPEPAAGSSGQQRAAAAGGQQHAPNPAAAGKEQTGKTKKGKNMKRKQQ